MNLKTLFTFNAIITLLFGLALALMPATMTATYGVTLSEAGLYITRLFGAVLIGNALLVWSAREAADSEARKSILFGIFVGDVIAFIFALSGQLTGVVNVMGWGTVAVYLFFAINFGRSYFSGSN